jgi:hypothetical protein
MNKLEPKIIHRKYWHNDLQRFLFDYIYIDDIPDEYRADFQKWLRGQTCPITEDPERTAVYWYDWIRWYHFKTGKARYLIFD